MYDATTCSPSGLAAAQGTNSIDPDLIDARGELLRLLVGRVILMVFGSRMTISAKSPVFSRPAVAPPRA